METGSANTDDGIQAAVELIADADALVITAGAGIGIDSGLPDFRGENGFWNAYPALGKLGLEFTAIANPRAFKAHPTLAWGFYGHRLKLYRDIAPHAGFDRLRDLASKMPHGARIFTSNVDGQFQKAGFKDEHITECHGSIHHLQCMEQCGQEPWKAEHFHPIVDIDTCTLQSPLPVCPSCGALARPNIMMFGDWDFQGQRNAQQESRLHAWLVRTDRPVVVEIGAGTAIPSVRHFGEEINYPLIRINPSEWKVGLKRDVSLRMGAMDALIKITDWR